MTALLLLKSVGSWLRANWLPTALAAVLVAAVLYVQGLRSDLRETKATLVAAEVVRDACLEAQKETKPVLDEQKKAVEDIKAGAKEVQKGANARAVDVLRAPPAPTPPPVSADEWNAWLEAQR